MRVSGRAALFALLFVTVSARAHEIGLTRVDVVFRRDHTYQIDVLTAPQSLLNKLEAATNRPRSAFLSAPELEKELRALTPELAKKIDVAFAGQRVEPRIEILPIRVRNEYEPLAVVIRLTGDISRNARAFTWRFGWSYTTYSLSLQSEDGGSPVRQWIEGEDRSAPFDPAANVLPPSRLEVAKQYLVLGFTHIVPYGLDHILFVLGIFLLSTRMKPILLQVTAFTIAHSITLGLSIYGIVSASPRVVEPLIALSIVYVAVENIATSELKPWRVLIVFAFGLLHGLGFAGVLRELGLPRSEFVTALVTFNVGVELGQLAVISVAYVAVASWARMKPWYRQRLVIPASVAIAVTGAFWTVQRLVS
jgi:hydrogenase/urease accessory protein HupE